MFNKNIANQLLKLSKYVLVLPRNIKRTVAFSVDISLCLISVWLAYYLRLGEFISFKDGSEWALRMQWSFFISVGIALPVFMSFGFYRAIFRYSGLPALLAVTQASIIYSLSYFLIFTVVGFAGVPRTIGIIQPIVFLLFISASRAIVRFWLGDVYHEVLNKPTRLKVLIYGASYLGRELASALTHNHQMQVVGFLDDDNLLHGQILNGFPIYNPENISYLISKLNVNQVLLPLSDINRKRRNEILNRIRSEKISVRVLPSLTDIAHGNINISDLRELDIEDLLEREPILPNADLMAKSVYKKIVMVTGAGGSIGSELCRQIMQIKPTKLILIENSEYALYKIHQELQDKFPGDNLKLVPLLVSVQDVVRLEEIILRWHPSIIFHAAAYKHVPMVELNIVEGIRNNVYGTLRLVEIVAKYNIHNFVLISTDKAVRPTNMMGASKRLAEMVLQAFSGVNTNTIFSIVRFGNVLGSSGSVVPKFREQIVNGDSISLTHPEVTRYFMTIVEAAQLVIQSGAMAKGGDLFLLDMGQPVKILDLAKKIIELSGLSFRDSDNPNGDISIKITGLRPGEKLYEELLIGDSTESTMHPRIMKANEDLLVWSQLQDQLNALESILNTNDIKAIQEIIKSLVTGYIPENKILDLLYQEQNI